jgi:hypothetical protein
MRSAIDSLEAGRVLRRRSRTSNEKEQWLSPPPRPSVADQHGEELPAFFLDGTLQRNVSFSGLNNAVGRGSNRCVGEGET